MRLIGTLVAMITVVIATGCGVLPSGPQTTPPPPPPGLSEPLSFHQVSETRSAPCPSGGKDLAYPEPDDPQRCLLLGPSRLTVAKLEQVGIDSDQSGHWILLITLQPADAETLNKITTELAAEQDPANRMAMIIGEELIMAPVVQGPIPGGKLQVTGNFTRDQVDALVKRLGG